MLTTLLALALGMSAFAQYGPGRYGGGMGYGYGYGHGPSGRGGYYMGAGTFEFGVTLNHFATREVNGIKPYRPDRVGFFGEYRVGLSRTWTWACNFPLLSERVLSHMTPPTSTATTSGSGREHRS